MDSILHDFRLAFRSLLANPGLSLTAIVSVALGIGPNVAIFSLANALMLRPLPIEEPERLVRLYPGSESVSYPDYRFYRDHNEVFEALVAEKTVPLTLRRDDELERLNGAIVTGNYFEALRIPPASGRLLEADDDVVPGAHPVAVVSHAYSQRRFAGNKAALGAILRINNHPFTVIGVAPPGFAGTFLGQDAEVWVPMAMQAVAWPGKDRLHNRRLNGLTMSGRLAPGVSPTQARSAMETLRSRLAESDPDFRKGWERVVVEPAGALTLGARLPVLVVTGLFSVVVALVLGVACANLANLLLARGIWRRREIAVRLALGAGRRRLVRQLLTESLALGVIGGFLGLFLALAVFPPLLARATAALPVRLTISLAPDPRVLAFTVCLSLVVSVAFGLAPALRSAKLDLVSELRGDRGMDRTLGLGGPRNALVTVQVALSVVVLAGGGLFLRSLFKVEGVDPGFDLSRNLLAPIDAGGAGLGEIETRDYYDKLLERLAGAPEVEAAGLSAIVPLSLDNMALNVLVDGEGRGSSYYNVVSPGFFAALGSRLTRGRDFSDVDTSGAPPVAIVNETLARRLWPGSEALGKELRQLTFEGPSAPYRVVGVAGDSKYLTLGEDPQPILYLPLAQHPRPVAHLHVRTTGRPEAVARQLQPELREVDGNVAIDLELAQEQVLGGIVRLLPELGATLLGAFALVGLAVASVGVYGLAAFALGRRRHEIGVRLALGGRRGRVLRGLLLDSMRPAAAGVAAGVIVALLVMRVMRGFLYGVSTSDPLVFGAVAALLLGASAGATLIPARRASKVDPGTLLRVE